MRVRFLLGALTFAAAAILVDACATPTPPLAVGLVIAAPEGLLDQATTVKLSVFDEGHSTCGADGAVTGAPSTGVQSFDLSRKGCDPGVTWCTTIELDKDGTKKMFSVVAQKATNTLAEGCTVATLDQDPLVVPIQVKRFLEPRCCNDGVLQPGEQCDTGKVAAKTCGGDPGGQCKGIDTDAVCLCDCTSNEILLSIDDGSDAPNLTPGAAGSKVDLALAFGPGSGPLANGLRAVFTNTDPATSSGGSDTSERYLDQNLYPIDNPLPLSLQLRVPVECSAVQSTAALPRQQVTPAIAAVGDTIAIVYASDENLGGTFDAFLVPQTQDGCDDSRSCTTAATCQTGSCSGGFCAATEQLNLGGETSPGIVAPRIAAGPTNSALVVWTAQDQVFGRIWHTDGSLSPAASTIAIASNASAARVAGNADGWRVAYQGSGNDIFVVPVDASGVVGSAERVNSATQGSQDQPDIAMLTDGRFLVAWHSGGDVFFQRFKSNGKAIGDDQRTPLNTITAGDQAHPAAAGSGSFGDFYAVAWETVGAATISARFVGGTSGFGYNSVTGQNDEFLASHPAFVDGVRHLPAVAVGGAGFVAIGWQDLNANAPGVKVRRFPLPE